MPLLLEGVYDYHTNLSNSCPTKIALQHPRTGRNSSPVMADIAVLLKMPLSLLEMSYLLDLLHTSLRLRWVFSEDLSFLWSYYKESLSCDWVSLAHARWIALSITLYWDTCRSFLPTCSLPRTGAMSDSWWVFNVIYKMVPINCHTTDPSQYNVEHCSAWQHSSTWPVKHCFCLPEELSEHPF